MNISMKFFFENAYIVVLKYRYHRDFLSQSFKKSDMRNLLFNPFRCQTRH